MSYSLNYLKGVIWGIIEGITVGASKADTRSSDNGSHELRTQARLGQTYRGMYRESRGPLRNVLRITSVQGSHPSCTSMNSRL